MNDDGPIRVIDNGVGYWPMPENITIIEELPDGSATVEVVYPNSYRVGILTADERARRDDWKLSTKLKIQKAGEEAEEQERLKERIFGILKS